MPKGRGKAWTCHACGTLNPEGNECMDCHQPRARGSRRREPVGATRYQTCGCETRGRRCTMPETIYPWPSPPDARGLCSWHWEIKFHGWTDTWDDFTHWLELENEHKACSNWTHYDSENLWRWTRGEGGTAEERPCRRSSCIVYAERDAKLPSLPRCTSEENAENMAKVMAMLKGKPLMQPNLPVVDPNAGW